MFEETLSKIARELQQKQISYMIIGGMAVLKYGVPRFTRDIDITLDIGVERYNDLKIIIDSLGYVIRTADPEAFIHKTMVLPVMEKKTGIQIDFIFSFSAFEKQALGRAIPVLINQVPVYYASLEDLIIHKIIAGRPRDIEDVKSILNLNPDCDINYLKTWLKEFDNSLEEDYINIFNNLVQKSNHTNGQ